MVVVVPDVGRPPLELGPHPRAEAPQGVHLDVVLVSDLLLKLVSIPTKFLVHHVTNSVVVGGPETSLIIPDGVKCTAPNHEIPGRDDLVVWIDRNTVFLLIGPITDLVEIHPSPSRNLCTVLNIGAQLIPDLNCTHVAAHGLGDRE